MDTIIQIDPISQEYDVPISQTMQEEDPKSIPESLLEEQFSNNFTFVNSQFSHFDSDENLQKYTNCEKIRNYFISPFCCPKEHCIKNINFCCNKNWFCKCTSKRIICGFLGLFIYVGGGILFWLFGLTVFAEFIHSLEFFIIINATETILSFLSLFALPLFANATDFKELEKLCVVIPVHGKDKELRATLNSLLNIGLSEYNIVIMENSGPSYNISQSKTARLMPSYPNIEYRYTNEWGSKVAAEYLGVMIAKNRNFKYVMTIDDDVLIPPDFDPQLSLLEKDVKMIAYPIKPSNSISNYLTRMQKREYRRSDRSNYFKQLLGTILFPHGAISTCEVNFYLDTMRFRPVDGAFFAEDQKKGAAWRWKRARIAMASGPEVGTEVPDNWCFFELQRVGSWDTGAHMLCGIYLEDFLTEWNFNCELSQLLKLFFRKLFQFQTLFTIFSDIVRPFFFVSFANSWYFWLVIAIIWECNNIIDILDDTFFAPHSQGKNVCVGKNLGASILDHHLSIFYSILQLVNGSLAACCGWVGAGAANPEDFGIKKPYPQELRNILDIKDARERRKRLTSYCDEVFPQIMLL
jgi:glycosyltransferase involved in cell wall biosynthesis